MYIGNWSDYEARRKEKYEKDLTPPPGEISVVEKAGWTGSPTHALTCKAMGAGVLVNHVKKTIIKATPR
jgi:hypothetical protein